MTLRVRGAQLLHLTEKTFTIGLVVHPFKDTGASLDVVEEWAQHHGVAIAVREVDKSQFATRPSIRTLDDATFTSSADGVLSLGGDGTMLGAMRLFSSRPVPILGVNHGHLGFLVEVEPEDLSAALARLVDDDFSIETYGCLDVNRDDGSGVVVAFNDLVVSAPTPGLAVTLSLEVNGSPYGYYRSDAVIISTAIGSTAYNYAAGGPVLSPSHSAVAVTPVAPMSGISRTIVFGPEDAITLHALENDEPATVLADGQSHGDLESGQSLTVDFRPGAGSVVRLDAEGHAKRGRVKLSLLDLPLLPEQMIELVPPEMRASMYRRDAT